MPVHIVLLTLKHTALLHTVSGGKLRLKHDGAAALDGAFVVRLCLLLVVGDELAVAEIFRGVHRFWCLLNDGVALLRIVGKGVVQAALELLAAGLRNFPEQLTPWVFLPVHERYPPSQSPPANIAIPIHPCRSIWLIGMRLQSLAPAVPSTRKKPSAATIPQTLSNRFRAMRSPPDILAAEHMISDFPPDAVVLPVAGEENHIGIEDRISVQRSGDCVILRLRWCS